MIEIITGRQGKRYPNKSRRIYREIGDCLKDGEKKLFLIVPEDATLLAEQGLMAENHLEGLINAEVFSLERLGYRVLSKAGGANRKFVDEHGKEMLLQKSIAEVSDSLLVYGSSASKLGFLDNICRFISELKQNDLKAEDLEALLSEMPEGRMLRQKIEDVLKIVRSYNENLGASCMDQEDLMAFTAEMIGQADFLSGAKIWIDGFESFSFLNFKIIEALAERASSITMTLTCDPDPNVPDASAFEVPMETLQWMQGMAKRLGKSFKITHLEGETNLRDDLTYLEGQLFSYCPVPFKEEPEKIEILQRMNPWEEVESCAVKIAALVRDHGFRYRDITVLTGDLETYGGLISRIFSGAELPYFMDESVNVTDNHFVEAVLAALETVTRGFLYEDIFSFIKSGFAPVLPEESEDLENYVIEFGIRGKKWEQPFEKESVDPSISLEKVDQDRNRIIKPLSELSKALKKGKTCREKTSALFEFLEKIEVQRRLEAYTEMLRTAGEYETMGWYNQIWNILLEVFDQAVQAMGDMEMDSETYIEILKGGLHSYKVGVIPQRRDVVEVTDLLRSRTRSMRALFILGFNEGVIPSSGQSSGILTEQERLRLKERNFPLQNSGSYMRAQEEFAIYNIMAKPEDFLSVSYSMMDSEGSSLGLSPLLGRLKLVFPKLSVRSALEEQADPLEQVSTPGATLGGAADYFRQLRRGEDQISEPDKALWQAVGRWYLNNDRYRGDYEQLKKALQYGGVDDQMAPGRAVKLFQNPLAASISRLEQYRKCPYAHYIRYGLNPVKRQEYTIEAPDIGEVLHGVIDGVCKESAKMGIDVKTLSEEQSDALVERLLNEMLPEVRHQVFSSTGQYRYLERKLTRVSKKTVRILIKQLRQGSFDFKCSEQKFLREFDLPSGGKLKLKGIIDRLDLYTRENGTYVKVIDYKSGPKSLNFGEVYYGLSLQLLVYMDAGLLLIPGEKMIPGGTFYFHVDDPLLKVKSLTPEEVESEMNKHFRLNGLYLDDPVVIAAMNGDEDDPDVLSLKSSDSRLSMEDFEGLLDYVKGLVIEMSEQILGGDVAISPIKRGDQTGCDYCDYRGVCQFDVSIGKAAYEVLETGIRKKDLMERIEKGEGDDEVDEGSATSH